MTGGCRCGALRYRLAPGLRPTVYACHCLDCQTWSGSAFTENAWLPREAISLDGPAATYTHDTPRGFVSEQVVCAVCHARICNASTAVPGLVVLRAGTLDASDRLEPVAHIWVRRKQPWLILPDGVPAWDETPPPEAFRAVLRRV